MHIHSSLRLRPHDPETNRLVRDYSVSSLLVIALHLLLWVGWNHRQTVTAVRPPRILEVEFATVTPPKPIPAVIVPPPPSRPAKAESLPAKGPPTPVRQQTQTKPAAYPDPLRAEAPPRPARGEDLGGRQNDDLAQRLRALNESLNAPAVGPTPNPASPPSQARRKGNMAGASSPPVRGTTAAGAGGAAEHPAITAAHAAHGQNPRPPYPALARARKWEGVVKVRVYVLPNGAAGQVQLAQSSGHDILDEAALQSVRSWRFIPARRGTQVVADWVQFPLAFTLER